MDSKEKTLYWLEIALNELKLITENPENYSKNTVLHAIEDTRQILTETKYFLNTGNFKPYKEIK